MFKIGDQIKYNVQSLTHWRKFYNKKRLNEFGQRIYLVTDITKGKYGNHIHIKLISKSFSDNSTFIGRSSIIGGGDIEDYCIFYRKYTFGHPLTSIFTNNNENNKKTF